MAAAGIVRRLDELCRLVLPIEIRRVLAIRAHDCVEFFVTDDRTLVLRKSTTACVLCGAEATAARIRGKNVCRRCLADARRCK